MISPDLAKTHPKALTGWRKAALIVFFGLATVVVTVVGARYGKTWVDRTKTVNFYVSRDGVDRKFADKLAKAVANGNEFVRIKVTPSDDPLAAFAHRDSDLVVARSDAHLPGWARSVAILEKEIVILAGRKGLKLDAAADLKKYSFIIFAPSARDESLLRAMLAAYDVSKDERRIATQSNVDEVANALRAGPPRLAVAVVPMSRLLRGPLLAGLAQKTPIALPDWPDNKALAQKVRGLSEETIDVGLFSVSPLLPAEDLDTVSLNDMLLTRSRLPESTIAAIAKAIFEYKSDLALDGEFATAIQPPDTDKDADILAHPGAVQYVNDDEKTFLDRYSDLLYLSMPVASVIGSLFLYIYTRLTRITPRPAGDLAEEVLGVAEKARAAKIPEDLDLADERLDEILHETLRDLQARRLSSEGLDVFRLAYEQTRERIRVKRRALADRRPLPE